jgi:hypothetical protein
MENSLGLVDTLQRIGKTLAKIVSLPASRRYNSN